MRHVPCAMRHAPRVMRHVQCAMRLVRCAMCHEPCAMRHVPCATRHASCATSHVLCAMRHAPSATRHASCAMCHVPYAMRHAPCVMCHAPCAMRHAPCAVCHVPCAMCHAPWLCVMRRLPSAICHLRPCSATASSAAAPPSSYRTSTSPSTPRAISPRRASTGWRRPPWTRRRTSAGCTRLRTPRRWGSGRSAAAQRTGRRSPTPSSPVDQGGGGRRGRRPGAPRRARAAHGRSHRHVRHLRAGGRALHPKRGWWGSDVAQIYQRVSAAAHGAVSRVMGDSTGAGLQSTMAGWSQLAVSHGRCPH